MANPALWEILVYNRNGAPFFRVRFQFHHGQINFVSHNTSRKQFFTKLLGLAAAAGLASDLVPNSAASTTATASLAAVPTAFKLRGDSRAVSRRAGSV